jgi:two-component system phosphate regulon sensor histidine kinase PhoR
MAALNKGQGRAVRLSDSVGIEMYYLARPVLRNGAIEAVLRGSMPIDILQRQLVDLYGRIALGAAAILCLAALVAFLVARKISRPIKQLMGTAERFARGELDHRSYVSVPDELRVLAETMNSMAAELRRRMDEADTKRKEAETILASMAEGVIVLDPNLKVTQANSAARSIMQVGSDMDPIGRTLLESFRATELKRYAEQVLETGEPHEGLLTLWAEGQRNLQVLASALPDRRGCLLVVHDITRLMQLETIRKDFVANVSHELRTPITSIKGFAETLADGLVSEDPERAKRYVGIVAKHAERLERIIEDLLALARLEQQEDKGLDTQSIQVLEILEDSRSVCSLAASEKGIRMDIDCAPELRCKGNTSILEQAFVNLLDNAIKYSPDHTEVRMTAGEDEAETVVKIIDQGRGIPGKDLGRIFERFYRVDKARSRAEGGTGLGLSIVKHVVSLHGGSVSVESEEGVGSTFTVRLPACGKA